MEHCSSTKTLALKVRMEGEARVRIITNEIDVKYAIIISWSD